MTSMSTGVGTSFKAILAMFHSHLTTPLTINDIGPPIALTMKVIIVSSLILDYKYKKLKEEKVVERFTKKLGKGRE